MKTKSVAIVVLALLISAAASAQVEVVRGAVSVSEPVVPRLTPALRDLPQYQESLDLFGLAPKERDTHGIVVPDIDMPPHDNPLAELQQSATRAPGPGLNAFGTPTANFAGVTSTCCPPDTTGDVGPTYFLQGDNGSGGSRLTIYNKSGTQVGQWLMETLGASPCNSGYCDPIIQYDELADRWMISEFDSSANVLCVYVSRTSDPTGQWWAYSFDMTSQGGMQDYPKYGVWPDGYYIGVNNGGYIHVLQRPAMLTGAAATSQTLTIPTLSGFGFQLTLPATLEGDAPPAGAPAIFARPVDTEIHTGFTCTSEPCDVMDLYEFHVDWATPANTTVTHLAGVKMAEFDHTLCGTGSDWSCMDQPGYAASLDPIREPIHFPLQYRNWGSYETLVGAFAEDVDGSDTAAVHWFEMRKVSGTWSMYQEGVLGGDGIDRSVASAAMDGSGNIAVGYTRTGSAAPYYPSIYYSGRLSTDTLGTMSSFDNTGYNATTSQSSSYRWGDYAGIGVDPTDDCTFWFTSQYGGSQQTRVIAFKFDQCGCLSTPAAPTAGASAPQANRITVTWNDSATATITRYWVYRSTVSGGPYTQIAEVADTSPGVGGGAGYTYNDDTVSGGIRYYYVVKSNDGVSCTSPASAEVNALATGACTLPPTFAGLTSATNPGSATCTVNLAWSAGTSNCSGTLTYNIYRSTTSGFTPAAGNRMATGQTGTSYSDSGTLISGTTYYYVVRAVDSVNAVEETNLVERSATPYGAGGGPQTFLNESFGTGDPPTGWTRVNGGTGTQQWTTTNPGGRTIPSGMTAPIEIIDSDTDGSGVTQDDSLISPAFNCTGASSVTLAFDTYFNWYSSSDTAYIDVSANNGSTWTTHTAWTADVGSGTTASHQTLNITALAGTATQVKVRFRYVGAYGWYWLVDNVVVTGQVESACSTGGCTAPGAPTLGGATGTCAGVNLSWTAGTGTTNSYNVYRSTNTACPVGSLTKLNASPLTSTTYSDTTAVAGTTYTYVVRGACDAGGVTESANSNCLAATRLVSPVPTISGGSANTCPAVTVVLTTEGGKSAYQWYDGGSPIGGATAYQYTVTATGSYTVSYTDTNGCSGTSAAHPVTIGVCAPNVVYQSHGALTEVTGDGDAYYERGEKWSVQVTLTNSGSLAATNVTAQLTGNGITVCETPGSFGAIGVGGSASFTYSFVISPTFAPCGGTVTFNVVNKACTELTPAGADQGAVFTIANVGQPAAGTPTELVIQPSVYDTYVNEQAGTTNYGTATTMDVQRRTTRNRRALVQFDLSGIPAGATVNSATLELYASAAPTTGQTLDVHRVTGTWTETGVTWNTMPAFTATADASVAGGTAAGWKTWTVTPVVQGWYAGTNTNYGFLVKCNLETLTTTYTYTFSTRENATTAQRPILRVNYTPATTWDCSYVGSGSCTPCLAPSALAVNTAVDLDACADTGVRVQWSQDPGDWGDGGGTRTYDVLRGGSPVQSGIAYGTTSYTDTTGVNGTGYTYTVRYNNGCGQNATTAGASASDAVGAPGAPAITGFSDPDGCVQAGVQITYTGGSGALSHDLYRDGSSVVTGYASGATYNPGDTASHSYVVRAVSGACTTDSGTQAGADGASAPPVVQNLMLTRSGTDDLNFQWDLLGVSVDRYEVYRAEALTEPVNVGTDFATQVGVTSGIVNGFTVTFSTQPNVSYYLVRAVTGSCTGSLN